MLNLSYHGYITKIYDHSINNPEEFWSDASNDIFWFKKPTKILNKSNHPFYKWFEDGVTNTCYNALDIHIDQGNGKRTALIYDSPITGNKNKYTYEELRSKVSKFAGKSRSYIANSLRLLSLSDEILIMIEKGHLTAGHARALIGVNNASLIAKKIVEKKLSVRQAEQLAKQLKDEKFKFAKKKDPNILDLQKT